MPCSSRRLPEHSAAGPVAEYYAQQRAGWGFLPNYAGAFSTRPDVAAAWNALNHAVRDGMDRRRFEIATIAAARAQRSTYCTAAHSKFLRDVCGDEQTMAAIAHDPSGSTLDRPGPRCLRIRRRRWPPMPPRSSRPTSNGCAPKDWATPTSPTSCSPSRRGPSSRASSTASAHSWTSEIAAGFDPELRATMIVGRPPAGPVAT